MTAVVVAGLGVGGLPARADADGPMRLLLAGDSIMQGSHGDWTWRYRLAKEFARQGVPVDFVGSRSAPWYSAPWRSAAYVDAHFDRNHFAQGGATLARLSGSLGAEVGTQQPDLVLLAAGVNDLRLGVTPETAIEHLRACIESMRTARPDVDLVVSPVLAVATPARPWMVGAIAEYNALLPPLVDELATAESPITLADTTSGWDVARDTYDGVHPTPTGETFIAQRTAEALHGLGVLPGQPSVFRRVAWTGAVPVRARLIGRRAVLTWHAQATTGARVALRRPGRKTRFIEATHDRGVVTTWRLKRRATYQVRVQLVRGSLTGPWGPPVTVRSRRR